MFKKEVYDLIVVGGGPAGLAAAMTAESEGIDTLLLESSERLGGQASWSSSIKNLPGHPKGLTGLELSQLLIEHASEFGTEVVAPWQVEDIVPESDEGLISVIDGDERVLGRTVLLAFGLRPRRLVVPDLAFYLDRGIQYGSPDIRREYSNSVFTIVGGANSAGQAATFLARQKGCSVNLVIRGEKPGDKMSDYLVREIDKLPNITVHTETEVIAVNGDGNGLGSITVVKDGNIVEEIETDAMHIMIGSSPHTAWLNNTVARTKEGFILTGTDLPPDRRAEFIGIAGRAPMSHETCRPGVFAAGDVRAGTAKRIVAALGDAATSLGNVHGYRSTA